MIDAIQTLLDGDATLGAILTGGVHAGQEISRQDTPDAFDEWQELAPCALVKGETMIPWGPHDDSGRQFVRIFLYERHGYTNIDAARRRIYTLLHRVKVTGGNENCYRVELAGETLGQRDDALDAALILCRYMATVLRN